MFNIIPLVDDSTIIIKDSQTWPEFVSVRRTFPDAQLGRASSSINYFKYSFLLMSIFCRHNSLLFLLQCLPELHTRNEDSTHILSLVADTPAPPNAIRYPKDLAYQQVENVDFTQQEMSYYVRNPYFSHAVRVNIVGNTVGKITTKGRTV
ncbi:uncharacterized protein VTP21DRAFT_11356 [Calcarisporiella thermophila]|uniref:uncharacterized protein n=1 Tax=Calcarisporiella thermophila TaxID=911321 RepID=UPI0037434515